MFLTATIISKQTHPSPAGYLTLFCLAIAFSNSDIYTHPHSSSAMGSAACVTCEVLVYRSLMYVMRVAPFFG